MEDRRYDPPTSAPPAVPQAESPTGPPDVVPSHQVYDDISTLTRKVHYSYSSYNLKHYILNIHTSDQSFYTSKDKDKEGMEGEKKEMKQVNKKEDEHMYHVLEGPTIVQVGCVGINII